ncbi:MAG: EFR1 family ferrodoxin [Lachnospiraceae bacterium]|nr:EFR1 family ferrodoxin [Lachnospiraceae bacterium]
MIFYFTGTGNSWYAAEHLKTEGEKLVSIRDCMQKKQYEFDFAGEEQVGFVFPVYFWGLPSIVAEFIRRMKTKNRPAYTYALMTCGGSIANASGMLDKVFKRKNWKLDAVYSLKMPDNYLLLFKPPTDEQVWKLLDEADAQLAQFRKLIALREVCATRGNLAQMLLSAAAYPLYVKGRKTAPFYADENCTGCGLCAGRCPAGAIEMRRNKPVWVKNQCVMCMSCTRCESIQYGKRLLGKRRYANPDYHESRPETE